MDAHKNSVAKEILTRRGKRAEIRAELRQLVQNYRLEMKKIEGDFWYKRTDEFEPKENSAANETSIAAFIPDATSTPLKAKRN